MDEMSKIFTVKVNVGKVSENKKLNKCDINKSQHAFSVFTYLSTIDLCFIYV